MKLPYIQRLLVSLVVAAAVSHAQTGEEHHAGTSGEVVSPPSTSNSNTAVINSPIENGGLRTVDGVLPIIPSSSMANTPPTINSPTLPKVEEVEEEKTPLSWIKNWAQAAQGTRRAKGRKSKAGQHSKSSGKDDHCDMSLFLGQKTYAHGCDGKSYEMEIYPKGRKKFMYKETSENGECISEGTFKSKDQLAVDKDGHCMLKLIRLRDSCDDSRSLSVRVVSPNSNTADGHLLLYFSNSIDNDEETTFYNQNAPREAYDHNILSNDDRRVLQERILQSCTCPPATSQDQCAQGHWWNGAWRDSLLDDCKCDDDSSDAANVLFACCNGCGTNGVTACAGSLVCTRVPGGLNSNIWGHGIACSHPDDGQDSYCCKTKFDFRCERDDECFSNSCDNESEESNFKCRNLV